MIHSFQRPFRAAEVILFFFFLFFSLPTFGGGANELESTQIKASEACPGSQDLDNLHTGASVPDSQKLIATF